MNSCPSGPVISPRIAISNAVGNVNTVTGAIRNIYDRDIGKVDSHGNASLQFPKRDNLRIDSFGTLRDFDNKALGKIEGTLPLPLPLCKKPYEWEKPMYEIDLPIIKREEYRKPLYFDKPEDDFKLPLLQESNYKRKVELSGIDNDLHKPIKFEFLSSDKKYTDDWDTNNIIPTIKPRNLFNDSLCVHNNYRLSCNMCRY